MTKLTKQYRGFKYGAIVQPDGSYAACIENQCYQKSFPTKKKAEETARTMIDIVNDGQML